ncbi:hypothetical protein E4U58_006947 [Claviceps cyperi]|nr:hypothetical protein E4U58_006947 [Claviceps cyperi]
MKFLRLIYIFGAIVSPVIANTVPNAEEVANTPGPSSQEAGHKVDEAGDPTADFYNYRRWFLPLPTPSPRLPVLRHRPILHMLSGPDVDSTSKGKDWGSSEPAQNSLGNV